MKDQVFSVLQAIGRSFMLPVAILPIAGLLLGIGASFTNATTIQTYGLEGALGDGTLLHSLLTVMSSAGNVIFGNLPIIFAVGVAIGMAKQEKEVAALAAMISFFVMHASTNAVLKLSGQILPDGSVADGVLEGTIADVCGILSLQEGVFGGIIVGLGVAWLHNRYHKIVLPNALSFFGGSRFIPIISTVVYMFVGIAMCFIWPVVQNGIFALGGLVTGTGYIGTLIFGIIKRALIPFGLHHVFYLPFWQTGVGGSMMIDGNLVQGGQNIFFAQLASPNVTHFSADATRYFSGEFIFMIFGLPGAALAMYRTAKSEKKKVAGGLLLSAALTSMLTGITEPIEFSFLFVAPLLFYVQVILAGAAYMIAHMLNIAVGLTFSGGLLDLFIFGILQGEDKTNWMYIIPVGVVYFFLYYFIFTFLIKKFDFKTPGREDDDTETKLFTKADVNARKAAAPEPPEAAPANPEDPAEKTYFNSPFTGELHPITDAPDEAFAGKMTGDGFFVYPTENMVYAPADGEVTFVFDTKHAIGMTTADGVEYLLHIGIDTVKLNGQGFTVFVEDGQEVKQGDKLMEFDDEFIKQNAPSDACLCIFTDMDAIPEVHTVTTGQVKALDKAVWF